MSRSRLVLIDGSSYLYRAFHALPPLTNSAGEPTGALFGVVNMLRATLNAKPDYAAFVQDAPGRTFRDDLYAEYKANREAMPDPLAAQVTPMLTIVEALGFPILRVEGVEADDVIGTLATQAAAAGIDVTVSTGDKDFAQLVRPGVELVNTMSNTTLDAAGVVEKFGVPPEQHHRPARADGRQHRQHSGRREVRTEDRGEMARRIRHRSTASSRMPTRSAARSARTCAAALPQLPLSRELATIKTDVALEVGPADLKLRPRDVDALRTLYKRYEFNAALKELDTAEARDTRDLPAAEIPTRREFGVRGIGEAPKIEVDPALQGPGQYDLVTTSAQFEAWIEKLRTAELIALDIETDSLDPMQATIIGLSIAVAPKEAAYIPLGHDCPGTPSQLDRDEVLNRLKPLLEDADKAKVGQNAKYDANVLSTYGITVRGLAHDTMLESYVLNSTASRHDMDSLAKRHLAYETIPYDQVTGRGAKQISFSQVDIETACKYAAEDADVTLRLHRTLSPKLDAEPKLKSVYETIEMPLVPVLARMEQAGVLLDTGALKRQSHELARRMHELTEQAYATAGRPFSLDSPKQLQAILFDELKLPAVMKTPSGQPSTNEEALEAIANDHALPRMILEYRGLAKLRSTYTEKLADNVNPRTGRVHTNYNQATAATGRLSSVDPNLQNIPIRTEEGRRIRQAFVAPPGWKIVAADYSQIELRIMAHLSGDAGLLAAFHGNQDIHRATAAEVFGLPLGEVDTNQRRAAKAINFGLMYGMSAFGLSRQLGVGRGEAQDYMARYFARYPGVREFMDRMREQAHRDGYVETLFGRRLHLDYINSKNQVQRSGAERAAINAPMQGTAADIIKRAMIDVDAWLIDQDEAAHMLMQVHDELVFEIREDRVETVSAGIRERMANAAELSVPLVVDVGVGANWDEAH